MNTDPTIAEQQQVIAAAAADSTDLILDYFAEVSAFELLDGMEARLTLAVPINHEADSVTQAKLIAEAFPIAPGAVEQGAENYTSNKSSSSSMC